mgnify:CR=1 FL=1
MQQVEREQAGQKHGCAGCHVEAFGQAAGNIARPHGKAEKQRGRKLTGMPAGLRLSYEDILATQRTHVSKRHLSCYL